MPSSSSLVREFFAGYVMVRARFVWRFERAPAPIDVDVESTFVLHVTAGVPRIVFQLEREDFMQSLRACGVLPAAS